MATQIKATLFDTLEKEFSPTIDSSLIAALLVELESDGNGKAIEPTHDQVELLRKTLGELALQAEESQQSEFSDFLQVEDTLSSWTTPDNGYETGELFGTSSGSSISSAQSFSSPLGFLQAALPEVPTERLRKALHDAGKDDVDIWDVVADILTEEYIHEMEERGLDGMDDEDNILAEVDWETVETKKKTPLKTPKKKSQARPQKIALADIRQQHHILPKKNGLNTKDPPPVADPWTQLSSLSEYVSSLVPQQPSSFFQSFFHSPKYSNSYEALRAALTSLCKAEAKEDHHIEVLYNLLDVIMPEYEDSDIVQRNKLISDVQLAVQITEGNGDEALDLVNVLRDLDSNAELGVYHLQPKRKADNQASPSLAQRSRLPTGPPPIEPPPPSKVKQKSAQQSTTRSKPSPFQWQAVPERKPPPRGPHPLAHHIPAYARDVNGMKTARAAGIRGGKAGAGAGASGWSGSTEFRRRMAETMRKRNEALREASRMWQRGNSKRRGGEVAFYFAERAREFQELARQEALNAARVMVQEKRTSSVNHDTVDLHGTTAAEAIVIVKEILKEELSSSAKPLKIITGRGSHSLNQVSVLKPAIRKALVEDGWSFPRARTDVAYTVPVGLLVEIPDV
ncbi:hypothetical protein CPC08DRAFT_721095 [Agrocybe pediades]|nr:hypothetical protein CPC08DRAFT_721095 [Agrocybe pediades]